MVPLLRRLAPRRRQLAISLVAVVGLAAAALVEFAVAKAFTLEIAKGAKVVNTTGAAVNESIVVTSRGQAVYYLTGDSQHHPKCASLCQRIWRPVTGASGAKPTTAPGLRGTPGIWHRGSTAQLTLAGRPLYSFINDHQKRVANGEGIASFGGTWHVIPESSRSTSPPPTTSTTSTTSTTNPYGY